MRLSDDIKYIDVKSKLYPEENKSRTDKTRQDKTTLFSQGSPISCKAGILRGPGFIENALNIRTRQQQQQQQQQQQFFIWHSLYYIN